MTDWFKNLMSGFSRAAQIVNANQSRQEQEAGQAARTGQSTSGSSGVAAALGHVAANVSSTNNELLADHEFPAKSRQGGCDVFLERNANQEPIRLRVKSLIYVYSDVVPNAVLVRKTAKIQTMVNNYWNNRIPVTRTLTLTTAMGGTLAFSYGGLPPLSVDAANLAPIAAAALKLQWRNSPQYDAIGNVEIGDDATLLVTFLDAAPRDLTDASTGGASIVENTPPADPASVPVGTYFTADYEPEWRAMGEIGDKYAPPRPPPPVPIVFEFEARTHTFAEVLDAAGRTREMNLIREQALAEARNVLWVHINNNDDTGIATSWAAGGLGSFRLNEWPGEYAHEVGHFMGFFMPRDPITNIYSPQGGHSPFNALMGENASKSYRRADQLEVDYLNFSRGLGGTPSGPNAFPGTILRERFASERKTVGHTINARNPDGTNLRDTVVYLDMTNFAAARAPCDPGE